VLGDDTRLQQVVWNLLINAIKFTPSGGRIQVRLTTGGNNVVRLEVSDTGKGIGPSLLPHVFEPFRQGDDRAASDREGLGLGLAIVKTIVERLGGTARAASLGMGRGATFTIELPELPAGQEREDRRPSERRPTEAGGIPGLSGVRALVVDDDGETRELLAAMLEQQGARVTAVGSAREALEIIRRDPLDVLLSDVHMPDESGYALIKSVRALAGTPGGSLPAVAVTAYGGEEERQRLLAAGFERYVPKPVDPETLAATVAELVLGARS
jgi:CheY-like chemotaxis protein